MGGWVGGGWMPRAIAAWHGLPPNGDAVATGVCAHYLPLTCACVGRIVREEGLPAVERDGAQVSLADGAPTSQDEGLKKVGRVEALAVGHGVCGWWVVPVRGPCAPATAHGRILRAR